jgi:hypothetical protein
MGPPAGEVKRKVLTADHTECRAVSLELGGSAAALDRSHLTGRPHGRSSQFGFKERRPGAILQDEGNCAIRQRRAGPLGVRTRKIVLNAEYREIKADLLGASIHILRIGNDAARG